MKDVLCDYCGKPTILVDDSEVYGGRSFGGKVYLCKECDAYVGVHRSGKHKGKPFGRLANAELRGWKVKAHRSFDVLWKPGLASDPMWEPGKMKRKDAYAWLASEMGIKKDLCHIGMFNIYQCKQVVKLCSGVPEVLCK